jgi:hypothetical protein
MPNTTNFNWPTPADTDLVKDGAAAIRNLGDGVDTSLVDLKGGTTGQILSKASNADMDFTFITPNVGDITEVQAGTGISVASGTGPIPVVTNSMATEITAKGDLIVGTGSGTFDNLPAGTNGYTLVAKSSEATGLAWEAPAMTLITSTTMSAVTSKAIDSIFTSTYDNYIINFTMLTSSSDNISFRLRASGSDDSTSFYDYVGIRARNSTNLIVADTALLASSWQFMGTVEPTYYVTYQALLTGPNLARNTSFQGRVDALRTDSAFALFAITGNFRSSTAFDGIKIYTNGGATMTGEIRVYGLRNS